MRLVTCICVLMVAASCVPSTPTKEKSVRKTRTKSRDESQDRRPADVLTVFLTGSELGELKPCGCSGGQLGGFERRPAILNSVPASKRMIVETGSLVESDSDQDLIKFNIMIEAFSLLDSDLANLTEKDVEIAQNLGTLDSLSSLLNIISSQGESGTNLPAKFTKQLSLNKRAVAVTVAAFDANSEPIENVGKLLTRQDGAQTVNILILNHCDAATIDSIAKMAVVDCLVCPSESEEPEIIGDPDKRPLVVSVGRYGRYIGKLQIRADEDTDKLNLSFLPVDVNESLPREPSLVDLYKDYQALVKDAKLLENQLRFPLPDGLEYTGSESCRLCHKHKYEYEKWSTQAHADAYATLERVGSQYDPECVLCHVIGMEYESGFVSEEKTGHLKNVGCENCHGPGSKHIESLGNVKLTHPMSDCTDCHEPEHSAEYMGNEQLYFEKIVHWREPNDAGNVK